jgi:hypothetical protein
VDGLTNRNPRGFGFYSWSLFAHFFSHPDFCSNDHRSNLEYLERELHSIQLLSNLSQTRARVEASKGCISAGRRSIGCRCALFARDGQVLRILGARDAEPHVLPRITICPHPVLIIFIAVGYGARAYMRPGRTDGCGIFWKKSQFVISRRNFLPPLVVGWLLTLALISSPFFLQIYSC